MSRRVEHRAASGLAPDRRLATTRHQLHQLPKQYSYRPGPAVRQHDNRFRGGPEKDVRAKSRQVALLATPTHPSFAHSRDFTVVVWPQYISARYFGQCPDPEPRSLGEIS